MNKQPHANVPIIPIPYVSEQITNLVRSSLKKVGLEARVIELKGISLRNTLIKNRIFDKRCVRRQCRVCPQIGEGACARRGVIYQIACSCGEIYIGESGRPLAERYNEHSRAAEKPDCKSYASTTWAKHSKEKHHGKPLNLELKVLDCEGDTVRRRILEGIHIKRFNPSLNTKEELTDMVENLGVT
ncbi:hypothetical protein CRE_04478 [Caenorhabditis remanei]|uniref:GIY-YIG domain-containing protein n=1 Tax=Caenorhabditis remanei TaxID=31234 RepID=E3NV63_CAERE|nr:hypothetical protein CRE_04478 [Caenorhabditis remanei]